MTFVQLTEKRFFQEFYFKCSEKSNHSNIVHTSEGYGLEPKATILCKIFRRIIGVDNSRYNLRLHARSFIILAKNKTQMYRCQQGSEKSELANELIAAGKTLLEVRKKLKRLKQDSFTDSQISECERVAFNCFNLILRGESVRDSSIKSINSFSEVKKLFQTLTPKSIVVFDVDSVLIEQQDAILQSQNDEILHKYIEYYGADLHPIRRMALINKAFITSKRVLIEPSIASIIYSLQAKGIPVIALTATRIGSLGARGSIQDWRIQDLRHCGIQFTRLQEPALDWLSYLDHVPLFKNGIVFSGAYPKGQVLQALLGELQMMPDKVVFFDDQLDKVSSVESHMRTMGVKECFCFWYKGGLNFCRAPNRHVAELQIRHLIHREEWLDDTAAVSRQ